MHGVLPAGHLGGRRFKQAFMDTRTHVPWQHGVEHLVKARLEGYNGRTCGVVVVSGTFRCDLSSFTTSTGSMRSTRTFCTTMLMNSV